ncbi:hypothetical protein [Burkholderia ubonensis]|uniref:hypothetical protein n=1 Tax=Burkholderia ubonensis TaxID=101571 RepID=UPI000BA5BE0B|nr:hypothetical protein [Burkholderia ubonensis]PAJ87956.1 hypothetical protein CJO70_09160 [Burkholderia ubonensis]PAJ97694.1 hypothetical protein CJO68_29865 [Burkholderia ubonensis]PAK08162.1 hypothetical protein CJO67_09400 [Burkholderia ubonensis]RQP80337.1 hypothetical protein DF014_21310 [Burkholderia ubonensis]RQP99572.1 hypothetical protein DF012_07960 [Burkholderia ubonensis]
MTIAQQLRDELRAAHTVIRNALAVMTLDQKSEWGCANERDDVAGEGVTRHHERQTVIAEGSPLGLFLELRRADRIIANAWEIQSFHQHALWSVSNQQDGVAATHPTRADSRAVVLAAAIETAHELVGDARGEIADSIVEFVRRLGDKTPTRVAWCGFDAGAPAGDQTVVVLKPKCKLSEADIAEARRVFQATPWHRLTLYVEQPAAGTISDGIDVEAMLRACVPGGDVCDPQRVADSIRAWFADVESACVSPSIPQARPTTRG